MKPIVKIFAYTAYSINVLLTILFIWNWDFRISFCIAYIALVILIPFLSRAILVLLRKYKLITDN